MDGIVTRIDLEGGFWGIIADDGQRYTPKNLPEALQRDGIRITFEISDERFMGLAQWGRAVKLTAASRVD